MDTLVRDPFREVMPAFFGLSLEEMLRLKHPNAWPRFERGELTEAEFLPSFFADGRGYDQAGFCQAIRSSYAWLEGMEAILERLSQRGLGMHVLSNYPVWHRWIEERLALSRYLSWSFVSCQMGVRKPERQIFERAAASLSVSPAECLLIDDRAVNCQGARELGMRALQYRGDAQLLWAELGRLGLS
jgi:FMN hydrolase / 5-amino-6-(5-phospho-D-ribitylamino)uracil phosphatase